MASQPPTGFPTIPSPSDILSGVEQVIPGAEWIMKLIGDMGAIPDLLDQLIKSGIIQHPMTTLEPLFQFAERAGHILEVGQIDFWTWMSKIGVGPFFTEFLELGMGVKVGEFTGEEVDAMTTVDTMLAFAVTLPIASAALNSAGKFLFANRWPDALHEALKGLPEEMGLTWPLGMTIEESFKAAQGTILEEAIKKQKRPTRLEWPQYKQLMKQHIFDTYTVGAEDRIQKSSGPPSADNAKSVMRTLLTSSGFTDEAIEWLVELSDVSIPVGDISQLYYRGVIDEPKVRELIGRLGFNDEEIGWLTNLYVTKAETQASVTYRSIAKQMYVNHLLTEQQYRAILTESNFPSRMIDEDIAGISLEQSVGHLLETVSLVKTQYLHKQIDPSEAARRLALLNYAPSYITELIASWDQPPIKAKHGLSTAKVLSYMISGLISPDQARPMLQSNGVDDPTVEFLLLHPTANTGAKQHALSPGLVTQAYMDGAIALSGLPDAYKRAGVADNNLAYYVNIAKYKYSHKRGNPGYTQSITAGEWRQAFKVGLIDFATLVQELESVGYPPDAAMLLAEIENKGPYRPPQAPAFATLGDALAYIVAAGYTIHQPPDPRLLAAENMAAIAGYTWDAPPVPAGGFGTLPPPTDTGQGTQIGGFNPP